MVDGPCALLRMVGLRRPARVPLFATDTNNKDEMKPDTTVGIGCSNHWLVTADRRSARLLNCLETEHGRLHLEEQSAVQEEWVESQHDRPSPRVGRDNRTYASAHHEKEERVHRFAKKVGAWIESELTKRRIKHAHAFIAPRFLGQLRNVLPSRMQSILTEHPLNLEHLAPGKLATHEAIKAMATCALDGARPMTRQEAVGAMATDHEVASKLQLEHAVLRSSIRDIAEELGRLRDEEVTEHPTGRLDLYLQGLEQHLRKHFALEERAGFLVRDLALDASLLKLRDRLIEEHRSFEHRLAALVDSVKRSESDGSVLSEAFVEELGALLGDLQKHEMDENELIQKFATGG